MFATAAASFAEGTAHALENGSDTAVFNRTLMAVERALTHPNSITGRSWYRHLIYAPKFTYASEVLPGLAEAVEAGGDDRLEHKCDTLATALFNAARVPGEHGRVE